MSPSQSSPTDPDQSAEPQNRANALTGGPLVAYAFGGLAAGGGLYVMIRSTTERWELLLILAVVVLLAGAAGGIERGSTRRGKYPHLAPFLLQALEIVTPLSVGLAWIFFGEWGTTPNDHTGAMLTTIGAIIIAATARRLLRQQQLARDLQAMLTTVRAELAERPRQILLGPRPSASPTAAAVAALAAAVVVRSLALTRRPATSRTLK